MNFSIVKDEFSSLNALCKDSALFNKFDDLSASFSVCKYGTDEFYQCLFDLNSFANDLDVVNSSFVFALVTGDDESYHIVAERRSVLHTDQDRKNFKVNVNASRSIIYRYSLDRFSSRPSYASIMVTNWNED